MQFGYTQTLPSYAEEDLDMENEPGEYTVSLHHHPTPQEFSCMGLKGPRAAENVVLRLKHKTLEWSQASNSVVLSWMDVIGASVAPDNHLVIFALVKSEDIKAPASFWRSGRYRKGNGPPRSDVADVPHPADMAKRKFWEFLLPCEDANVAEDAAKRIKKIALGTTDSTKRKFKIILNPHGGSGRAREILTKRVAPLLSAADVSFRISETSYPGHATDMGKQLDVNDIEGVLFISGDGTVQQFLQGIMSRPDWRFLISRIPIASLGSGTANALSVGIRTNRPEDVVHAILKCRLRSLDAIVVTNAIGRTMISVCGVGWGVPGDIAASSESYRSFFRSLHCSGTLRYCMLKCTKGFCCRQRHHARIMYTTQPIAPMLARAESVPEAPQRTRDGSSAGDSVISVGQEGDSGFVSLPDFINGAARSLSAGGQDEVLGTPGDRKDVLKQLRSDHSLYISYQLDFSRNAQWDTIQPKPKGGCFSRREKKKSQKNGNVLESRPVSSDIRESSEVTETKRSRGQTFTDGGLLSVLMNGRERNVAEHHHDNVGEKMKEVLQRREQHGAVFGASVSDVSSKLSAQCRPPNKDGDDNGASAPRIEFDDGLDNGETGTVNIGGVSTEWRFEQSKYLTIGGLNTAQEGFAVHPSDGYLDLIIAREGNIGSILALGARYICGDEYTSPLLDYKKATAILVDPIHDSEASSSTEHRIEDGEDRRDAVNVDGEVLFGPGPFVIQVLPALVTAYGEAIQYEHSPPPTYNL
eukprot:gb/GECG01016789.1/.p1 GENE.gb/GECG01016789.1/~~gb/GECG01016789.1/.p1  ORF type:complete len:754 (+),score=71.30 gb/GECG01016789.1/:1-2262(+)